MLQKVAPSMLHCLVRPGNAASVQRAGRISSPSGLPNLACMPHYAIVCETDLFTCCPAIQKRNAASIILRTQTILYRDNDMYLLIGGDSCVDTSKATLPVSHDQKTMSTATAASYL